MKNIVNEATLSLYLYAPMIKCEWGARLLSVFLSCFVAFLWWAAHQPFYLYR